MHFLNPFTLDHAIIIQYIITASEHSAAEAKIRKQKLPSIPASNHHTQKLRAAQLREYDAQACLVAALGVTEPQPCCPTSYADMNKSFDKVLGRSILMEETPLTLTFTYLLDKRTQENMAEVFGRVL